MAAKDDRDPIKYEVAVYDYAQKRITLSAAYDEALPALVAFTELLRDHGVPLRSAHDIRDSLHTLLLTGGTLYEHEALASNCRLTFVVRNQPK